MKEKRTHVEYLLENNKDITHSVKKPVKKNKKDAFPTFRKTTKHSEGSSKEPHERYAGTVYAIELLIAAALVSTTWIVLAELIVTRIW